MTHPCFSMIHLHKQQTCKFMSTTVHPWEGMEMAWGPGGPGHAERALLMGKLSLLKYPQQETAISHRHAKTAVPSQHQGGTWKELLPVGEPSLDPFSRCFCLAPPMPSSSFGLFKKRQPPHPPLYFSQCNPTHAAVTIYPLTLLTSPWLCDKHLDNQKTSHK